MNGLESGYIYIIDHACFFALSAKAVICGRIILVSLPGTVFVSGSGVSNILKCSVMKRLMIAALVAGILPLSACDKDFDNSTVSEFDLSRYLGEWYEIARYDHSFEKGMTNTMAEYILQDNGKVVVLNTGWKDGKFKLAEGKAKYPDPDGDPGALRVSFFLFFYSDYNVMMVDENYQISLVGSRAEKYLWILSRTPVPDPDLLDMVLEEAARRGYDTSKLIWVDQSRNIEALENKD